ncbi:unnamed protein product, partial [marine sediment metagenome]
SPDGIAGFTAIRHRHTPAIVTKKQEKQINDAV